MSGSTPLTQDRRSFDPFDMWRSVDRSQRVLYAAGVLLVLGGLAHLGVWMVSGTAWEGPLSYRKPMLFGLATGVTCISLAWVAGWLPGRRRSWIVACIIAGCAVVEVGLITLQTWRGVPSHFNTATPFDKTVGYAIDVLITGVTFGIADMTLRAFRPLQRGGIPLARDRVVAIRWGMVLLLLSCLFGYGMLVYGIVRVNAGLSPEIFGEAGVPKFVHGMPMHAIQILPLACGLFHLLSVPPPERTRLVHLLALGCVALTVYAAMQTFAGRARFDTYAASLPILILAMLLLVGPFGLALIRRSASTT